MFTNSTLDDLLAAVSSLESVCDEGDFRVLRWEGFLGSRAIMLTLTSSVRVAANALAKGVGNCDDVSSIFHF